MEASQMVRKSAELLPDMPKDLTAASFRRKLRERPLISRILRSVILSGEE
jgi:hypothetical protein